jgi:hypothetical protein
MVHDGPAPDSLRDAAPDPSRVWSARAWAGDNDLELLLTNWHERWAVHDHPVAGEPWENVYAAAHLNADLDIRVATPIRESR